MFIHMQMAKEKQNLLLVTFEKKIDKARFEYYLLKYVYIISVKMRNETKYLPQCISQRLYIHLISDAITGHNILSGFGFRRMGRYS